MKKFFRNDLDEPVDAQIEKVLLKMDSTDVESSEYLTLVNHLDRLMDLKKKRKRDLISRDTLATIGGNLIGILIIVIFEQKHVMNSKAFNQLVRPK